MSALVTGEILESPFEDGDQVEQDQLLYRIDPGSAQTALQQAQLSVQQAQMNYDTLASSLQVKAIGGGVVQTLHVQEGGPGLRRDGRCRHHRHLHHDPHGALPGR